MLSYQNRLCYDFFKGHIHLISFMNKHFCCMCYIQGSLGSLHIRCCWEKIPHFRLIKMYKNDDYLSTGNVTISLLWHCSSVKPVCCLHYTSWSQLSSVTIAIKYYSRTMERKSERNKKTYLKNVICHHSNKIYR